MRTSAVSGTTLFEMKFDADLSFIHSVWARVAFLVRQVGKSWNLSIALRRECMSGFRSSSLFLSLPELPPSESPALSYFHRLLFFCDRNSTQAGGGVIHSPRSTRHCNSPNSNSAHFSTSSRDVVLHQCRNTCTRLWVISTISAPKRRSPAKSFSYCRSKRSMWHVHVVIACQRGPSVLIYPPAICRKFCGLWQR